MMPRARFLSGASGSRFHVLYFSYHTREAFMNVMICVWIIGAAELDMSP